MIRLRSLLLEADNTPKLRVLFVGDHQTKSNWSYAKQLIADGVVKGKVVGWTNATTDQLYRILKSNISKRYDVISIMGGDADSKSMDPNVAISNLDRCYALAKKYGAKVVAISNPSKLFLEPGDKFYSDTLYPSNDIISNWVASQDKTDVTINTLDFGQDAFTKDNYRLNASANRNIANQWKSAVMAMNLSPRVKTNEPVEITMRLGDSGPEVKTLHDKLIGLGYNISWMETTTSTFGVTTFKAVEAIQLASKLPVTGIIDEKTKAVLNRLKPVTGDEDEQESVERSDKLSGSNVEYVQRFATLAVDQMKKYGIPASIILAQGILESASGTSDLTIYAYNHFGIKGSYNGQKWCGKTSEFEAGKKVSTKACFRKYPDDAASYEDHSELLQGANYQKFVKKYATSSTDYKGWAKALQAAGYATSPTYANTLIKMIEQLDLQKYDIQGTTGLNTLNKSTIDTNFKPQPSQTGKNGFLTGSQLKSIGAGLKLSPAAADAYLAMKQASFEDGLKESDWDITDAYRSYEVQDAIFDWDLYKTTKQKAKKGTRGTVAAAYPGTSNHGLGLAIDISGKAQDWIRTNGEKFGWSWDEGKSVGEPWHFRYKF